VLIDLERHEIPELDRRRIEPDSRLGEMKSATDRNAERLRQFPRQAKDDRDVGTEASGDATFRSVDARNLITRQQVVELFRLQIHCLGNGRQIIDWQISSHARNKTRRFIPNPEPDRTATAIKMSSPESG
jgi:hypothetical protein